ncbi:hypothetical protein M501DRAFT_1015738 [Patellaria atrata CBS 101060]|uniref:HIT-type domain-containing protein n=1 Tax=Patellaria atrata CBS 101060 TaxID=1346257 RepID=A0A9P4SDK7_9PEZI|nr:hypothetical protein M501DRAFT_1015738 [Patellaria atrata CBS 101060]
MGGMMPRPAEDVEAQSKKFVLLCSSSASIMSCSAHHHPFLIYIQDCPKCSIQYCSVKCFKSHDCNQDRQTQVPQFTAPATLGDVPLQDNLPKPNPLAHPLDNLHRVHKDPRILELLASNPHLRAKLRDINTATCEPSEEELMRRQERWNRRGRGGTSRDTWNRDAAHKRALRMLKNEREEDEKVREFHRLVIGVLGTNLNH